jgi:hypothetical protein
VKRVALLAVLFAACGETAPPALQVGPVAYSENELLGLSADRRRSLAELTAFALAVADSSTTELGAPLVESWAEDRVLDVLAADLTLEKNGVDDEVLEARYLTDPEWELTVRHILFFSERWRSADHRAEAAAKAERALEQLRGGADFAETAAALSEEPGAEGRQGLLTPGRRGSWVPEFWAAALALEPGEFSSVTETQYGFHILRLEDRSVVPFAEARSTIAREVADRIEDPAAVLDEWLARSGAPPESRRSSALAEAARRGVALPSAERAELRRNWDDQVGQWSATLGFRYGLGPEQVARAALEALSASGQGASLAKAALAEHADLLRARYSMRLGADG